MNDLVKRLTGWEHGLANEESDMVLEAIDTIEQQAKEITELMYERIAICETSDRQAQDIQELVGALRKISRHGPADAPKSTYGDTEEEVAEHFGGMAREALSKHTQQGGG